MSIHAAQCIQQSPNAREHCPSMKLAACFSSRPEDRQTANDLSARRVYVHGTTHVNMSGHRNRRLVSGIIHLTDTSTVPAICSVLNMSHGDGEL